MIRIVADTNIYVSAIVFGRTCEEILALARSGIVEINISPAIQRELRRVLRTGFQWTEPQVRAALTEVETLTSPAAVGTITWAQAQGKPDISEHT